MSPAPFDLAALATAPDPIAWLGEARAGGPVQAMGDGFWAVTGYDEAVAVMHSPDFISSPLGAGFEARLPEGAARDEMRLRINFLDPPDHPRVRSLVAKAFTPRRITDLRPWMEATAVALVSEVDTSHPFDLLRDVGHQLPSLVISELLGIPLSDRSRLTGWSDQVSPLLGTAPTADEIQRAIEAAEQFHAYLGALLDERRDGPGADLLSALVLVEEAGERLSRPELLSLAATLYSAGHRTTRDAFTNGVAWMLLHRDELWLPFAHGAWEVPEVATEILRHQTPTMFVARIAALPTRVGGVEIAPGDVAMIFLAAANRDPLHYDDPDAFRPGRGGPPALSFAHGAHYCLGASLARAEIEVLLAAVATAWPDLRLADSASDAVRWHQRGPFRGVDALVCTIA
jgi:cytochrome P450